MIKNITKFRYTVLFTLLNVLAFAQPPIPGGGGAGASGTGAAASPIDMYVYFLAAIAILFTAYFAKKYTKQLSK